MSKSSKKHAKRTKPPGSGRQTRAGAPTVMTGVRLTTDERDRYQAHASARGESLSDLLRQGAELICGSADAEQTQ